MTIDGDQRPLLALSGHHNCTDECPLLGVRRTSMKKLPVTLLKCADELCIGQYVALHCSLDLRFRRVFQIERDIQRVELMEVTVPADRRTGAAIARLFKIVKPE